MTEIRTWHTIVESQLEVCPCCGAHVILEVKDTDEKGDIWGDPYEGEQDESGKLWRIICPSCGLRMYETNWHYLIKKWNRRYVDEKMKTAIDKACGQLEHWIPRMKNIEMQVEALVKSNQTKGD